MSVPPTWLPPSALSDIALLMRGLKPAARIQVGSKGGDVRKWARRNGLFASADLDGYAVLSRSGLTARRALEVDRRPGRHTIALGRMLGYPECCSRAAARTGDEGIDAMAETIAARRFRGRFRLVDPANYRAGSALISHVPCSHVCEASAKLAAWSSSC